MHQRVSATPLQTPCGDSPLVNWPYCKKTEEHKGHARSLANGCAQSLRRGLCHCNTRYTQHPQSADRFSISFGWCCCEYILTRMKPAQVQIAQELRSANARKNLFTIFSDSSSFHCNFVGTSSDLRIQDKAGCKNESFKDNILGNISSGEKHLLILVQPMRNILRSCLCTLNAQLQTAQLQIAHRRYKQGVWRMANRRTGIWQSTKSSLKHNCLDSTEHSDYLQDGICWAVTFFLNVMIEHRAIANASHLTSH